MPFLFGPLVYLYAATAADRSRRLTWRDALHLIPFVAVIVVGLPVYLMSGAEKIAFYGQLQRGEVPLDLEVANHLKLVSGAIYTAATIIFLRRHRERVKQSYSSLERVNLKWLLWLGLGVAFTWTLAVSFQLLESAGIARVVRGDDFISLSMAVVVYGIGYMGLRQPEIFRYDTAEYRVPVEVRTPAPGPVPTPVLAPIAPVPASPSPPELQIPEPELSPRYERSGLTDREAQRLKNALALAMDKDRLWRDSDLTLADLADRLSTTPHKLSEVLNSQLGQTFYDFVNGYRVREVQRRITAGEAQKVNMLTLAMDAGFASKSTFNMVFKKHTSKTPSDYRQSART